MPEPNIKRLKAEMIMNDIDQKDLADILSISVSSVSRKMNDKSTFTLEEGKILAEFFGMTIEGLFFSNNVAKKETKAS